MPMLYDVIAVSDDRHARSYEKAAFSQAFSGGRPLKTLGLRKVKYFAIFLKV